MKLKKVNVAIQVLPQSDTKHPYSIVDIVIEQIRKSGLKYMVCPFETVVEGNLDEIFKLVSELHETCYNNETKSMMVYMKIQSSKLDDVLIMDKMEKYI